MSTSDDYVKLYEEYKAVYKQDRDKAKELNSTFDMQLPKKWDQESVRLKAFLDREHSLYVSELAPFEYLLKSYFHDDEQSEYEKLVRIYRDEYFLYQQRVPSYGFILNSSDELISIAQEYALEQDEEVLKQYLYRWQKKLDLLKSENVHSHNITELRMQESVLLSEYEHSFSMLTSTFNKYAKSLSILLQEYSYNTINKDIFRLTTYFQDMFNLLDDVDLLEYAQLQEKQKSLHPQRDITQIRALIQKEISENNKQAELAQFEATDESMGEILLKYASREQEIVSLYRGLVTKYLSCLALEGDFLLVNRPFELYFDNYFADFENSLNYYKVLYKDVTKPLTQTPYYVKMYNATEAKVSVLNLATQENMEEIKKAYISERTHLTDLKVIERKYAQEFDILLGEFERYGEMYIKEIQSNANDLQEHKKNIDALRARLDLREENGFF